MQYAWCIAVNLIYIFVVWAVLDQVHDRPESVLLPVLGILYVTLRTIGIGMAKSVVGLVQMIEGINRRLRAMEPGYEPEDRETIRERDGDVERFKTRMLIDSVSLTVISLLCLFYFLVAIGTAPTFPFKL